jgi:putative addiction module killer protein
MQRRYELREYSTKDGKTPFGSWLLKLKDKVAQAKIRARLLRVAAGNFGDSKPIQGAKGLFELREHYGPGYRIFYCKAGQEVILLLAGSGKKDQSKAIEAAKNYMRDYEERTRS